MKRYKLLLSEKVDGVGGVKIMVMEELCAKVVDVVMVHDGVMTVVIFEEDVMRSICGYAPQSERSF